MLASDNGLFQLFIGFLVEGDCYTRSTVHWVQKRDFNSLADLEAAIKDVPFECEFEIRYPKNYIERMKKLWKIKEAKQKDFIPF